MASGVYAPVVQELVNKIGEEDGWLDQFEQAVKNAVTMARNDMQGIETLGDFYNYMNGLLKWVPFEEGREGREIYKKLCIFYFVFGRDPVVLLQTPIKPEYAAGPLSWLSNWLVRYAQEAGKFMDTPESFTEESLQTFRDAQNYNMGDYIEPHGGWKTFNHFFARNTKPGYRPIASMGDHNVIVSPADSTFEDQWSVDSDSVVNIKGLDWSISELLKDSDYKDAFQGGTFMHSFLKPNDYHRLHTPVEGTVVEAKVIKGQVYLEVTVDDSGKLQPIRHVRPPPGNYVRRPTDELRELEAPNTAGYQFCQMRGLFVLHNTQIGLVAVLPIGMAQVSSVIPTAEKDRSLHKGEELAYFQFGGSDIVIVFQQNSQVTITAEHNKHYKMGEEIGKANPIPP